MTGHAARPGRAGVPGALRLDLPAAEEAVEEARQAVIGYLTSNALSPRLLNQVEVVLEELVSNVVRHCEGSSQITIEASLSPDLLLLTVIDDGVAFDPTQAAAPRAFTTLEEATPGGLGIAMVRKLAKSLSYERTDGFNRVSAVMVVQ